MIKKGLSIVLLCAIAVTAVVLWGRWNPNAANEDGRPKTPLLSGLVEGDAKIFSSQPPVIVKPGLWPSTIRSFTI